MEFEHAVNCLKNDMIEGVSFMAVGSVWLPCCDENVEKIHFRCGQPDV